MVQEYQSPIRVYKATFEMVMAAYEKRFPTSPLIPVFLSSEVLQEFKSEDGAIHMIERRCKLAVDAPGWFKKLLGVDFVYFIQKNTLNRRDRTLLIEAHNESFASKITVTECCHYKVHPENPDWTAFDQEASLKIKSFLGLESHIEKYGMRGYLKNVDKGKEIIEHYLEELRNEGITYIPPFSEPEASASGPNSSEQGVALDVEYIRRYLGDLTSEEESHFMKLRQRLARSQPLTAMLSDSAILRFLRARDFNVDKAFDMATKSIAWRQKLNANSILSSWHQPKVISDYLPAGWHKTDKDGRPIFIFRIGQLDVKGLMKSVSEEDLINQLVFMNETGLKLAENATESSGKPISSFTCICDCEGLGLKHLWRPGVSIIQHIIATDTANYPETMNRLVILRAPRLFPVLWSIVRNLFDERTRDKVVILGDNYEEKLKEYMDDTSIPTFWGGKDTTSFSNGGTVDSACYLQPEVALNDSLYKVQTVGRASTFRVPIQVEDADTVITWDFYVHGNADVGFGLFYTKDTFDNDSHASNMIEVEKTQRVKDATQGTYICDKPGHYVLRWDNTFSMFTSKTISYSVEVIDSEIFRRSLTSLTSALTCNSAFSIDTSETTTSTTAQS